MASDLRMVMRAWIAAVLVAASVVWWLPLSAQVPAPVASAPDGAAVFERECSMCHTGAAETRAPAPVCYDSDRPRRSSRR